MSREKQLDEGMYSMPKDMGEFTLQPFTLAIGQILEEKGNRYAKGGNFQPKMSEVNELMFVMTHDIETILAIRDEDWRKEMIRFAATLDEEKINSIQAHTEGEINKTRASEAKPRGKGKGGAAG